jgi:hypothetical protein
MCTEGLEVKLHKHFKELNTWSQDTNKGHGTSTYNDLRTGLFPADESPKYKTGQAGTGHKLLLSRNCCKSKYFVFVCAIIKVG